MKWMTTKPQDNQTGKPCIATILCSDGKRIVRNGWYGWGNTMRGTVAYMNFPVFNHENKKRWKSEYFGDDLPKENGHYIVAVEKSYGIVTLTNFAWFNATKNCFSHDNIIAWHAVPIAYKGVN